MFLNTKARTFRYGLLYFCYTYFIMSSETESLANFLNYYLSLATLLGAVVLVVWLLALVYSHSANKKIKLFSPLSEYALPIGFLVTLVGVFLSLYYSQVLGYEPCELCWFQRIFLYPQVILFAIAWWKKDTKIYPYIIGLSAVGLFIAGYHHLLQIGYDLYKPCSSALFAVSCSKPSFIEFGFVSFPFMAVVMFGFLILLSVTAMKNTK